MTNRKSVFPPNWATSFLTWYCRPELLEDLQGDLNEYFERNLEEKGAFTARLIYAIDVLKFFRMYTVRKPAISKPFSIQVMLASYVKTSQRSILRNKLFSGINIFGLAVSMSVGLLVISVVFDLFSYDNTLKNRERIYRVTSTIQPSDNPPVKLATTSLKSGILIRQSMPGIDAMVIMRRDFGGDAKTEKGTVPVSGLYADSGFFDVFSYPLLKGVASTALKEPNSMVLTQTTAKKLFGEADPMGKVVKVDTVNYTVTGLLADLPTLSHMKFDMLVSLSSSGLNGPGSDGSTLDWANVYSNYVYVLLSKNFKPATFTAGLNEMDRRENASLKGRKILLSLQPTKGITIGRPLGNEIGPVFNSIAVFILAGLALIVILSACFNYTNLSIARSLRRSREVGIRKVIGAQRKQVIGQFITESVFISLLSLCIAFLLFLLMREQFLSFHPFLRTVFTLRLSPRLVAYFIMLAVAIGILSGILPALFYSKTNAAKVLKDVSSLKVFRHVSLRKALIVAQYTFSLIFITTTVIGYNQYKSFLRFDLGFSTENILNIDLQGNKDDVLVKGLSELPGVKGISKSLIVSSLGSLYGSTVKYKDPMDSTMCDINKINENYLLLHKYTFLAGRNFTPKPQNAPETETIVNEEMIRRFQIGHADPQKAIGELVTVEGKKLMIIGVLKDFHYGTLESKIDPTAFEYSASPGGHLNVKITNADLPSTMTSIETLWKRLDNVHPLVAKFYDDQIEEAYSQFTVILKVIGFFALLAICISSLGLFGMVIYTMEKRLKEVSIRKVLGAGEVTLIYLLSKGFLFLLLISAMIAIPITLLLFNKVVLVNFAYHQPIHFGETFAGLFIVAVIAVLMIGAQTMKIVRANPANVLKNE